MSSPKLAVVVPTFNEAARLPALFASLAAQTEPADELWIADGGSTDGTPEIAERSDLKPSVMRTPTRGRGGQIAAAVAKVTSEVILVLHADSTLSRNALAAIREALRNNPICPGGALGHRFDVRTPALAVVEFGDWWRARFWGKSLGDQGQFFRRQAVEDAGGFPPLPIMEDVALADLLRKLGRPMYLGVPVATSARRFARLGVWTTLRRNARFRTRFRREGPSAAEAIFREYYGSDATSACSR